MTFLVLATALLAVWLMSPLPARLLTASRRARLRRRWEGAWKPRRRRAETPPDPFEVLRVQARLEALANEIRAVEADPRIYAKGHRLVALRAAYDDLLTEACALAGVPVGPEHRRGDVVRWRAEQELAARGWSW